MLLSGRPAKILGPARFVHISLLLSSSAIEEVVLLKREANINSPHTNPIRR